MLSRVHEETVLTGLQMAEGRPRMRGGAGGNDDAPSPMHSLNNPASAGAYFGRHMSSCSLSMERIATPPPAKRLQPQS